MTGKGLSNLILSALAAGAVGFLVAWCPGPLRPVLEGLGLSCTPGAALQTALLVGLAKALGHLRTSPLLTAPPADPPAGQNPLAKVAILALVALGLSACGTLGGPNDPLANLIPRKANEIVIPTGVATIAYGKAMYLLGGLDATIPMLCAQKAIPDQACQIFNAGKAQAQVLIAEIEVALTNSTAPVDWGAIIANSLKVLSIAGNAGLGNYAPAIGAALGTLAPAPAKP